VFWELGDLSICYPKWPSSGFNYHDLYSKVPRVVCLHCLFFLRIFFYSYFSLSVFFTKLFLQIEPIITGNLPPGFDISTCRSV
jgi:hypothetical protein